MANNYAERYASAALEAFALDSITNVFAAEYEWTDVKTVNVFTNDTVTIASYTATAGFGTPTRIGNTKDAMTVTSDIAFSALLDRLDMTSVAGSLTAGEWLGTQIRQKVTPYIDKYNFLALWTACPTAQISASAAITSATAYTTFLTGNAVLDEAFVPGPGRVVFASPAYLNLLKIDSNYVKASDLAQQQLMFNGQVGEIDGVPVIKAPDSIMNATDKHIDFMIVHRSAVCAPVKLADYQIVEASERYSGSIVNGRIVHDLFLLDALNTGIYIHKHA